MVWEILSLVTFVSQETKLGEVLPTEIVVRSVVFKARLSGGSDTDLTIDWRMVLDTEFLNLSESQSPGV